MSGLFAWRSLAVFDSNKEPGMPCGTGVGLCNIIVYFCGQMRNVLVTDSCWWKVKQLRQKTATWIRSCSCSARRGGR